MTKPLCLRHRVILESIKSPFVEMDKFPEPKDVIIFSKIVSSYDMAEMMPHGVTDLDVEWMRKMSKDQEVFEKQVEQCLGCIEDQSKWPVFWNSNKASKTNGAPWVLSMVCNLVKNGVPLESAWTMPESQAVWMNAVFSIASGADINIVSDEDRRAMEQLRELEEKMAKDPSLRPKMPTINKKADK